MDQRYDVIINPVDETYVRVFGEPSIEMEISTNYTFSIPNAHFLVNSKKTKKNYKGWDGKIRLYNRKTNLFPKGLLDELLYFLDSYGYSVANNIIDEPFLENPDTLLDNFIAENNLPFPYHDYQRNSIEIALKERRGIHVCGTGGGKSYIIYTIARIIPGRTLIIVPTVSLVHQLTSDFKDYSVNNSFDVDKEIHPVYAGQEKFKDTKLTISTWQSLQNQDEEYFKNFDTLMVDECHTATGKELMKIIEKSYLIKNRYGFSGTLQKWKCSKLQLYGLLGKINIIKTAKELIDDGYLAPLKINCLVLKYTEAVRKQRIKEGWNYETELEYISSRFKRIDLIAKLATRNKKKCLITFRRIKLQGDVIYKRIMELNPDKPVYYITGKTEGTLREDIRKKVEEDDNCIIIATESIFSTGINIKSLDVLILASPSKSFIRIIQSIGRILRKSITTEFAEVWDIADDIAWKSDRNYALESYIERTDIYLKEKHKFNIKEIEF